MKFKVIYFVGESQRTKIINAVDLDDAERKLDEKGTKWDDIIMVDKTKGKADY